MAEPLWREGGAWRSQRGGESRCTRRTRNPMRSQSNNGPRWCHKNEGVWQSPKDDGPVTVWAWSQDGSEGWGGVQGLKAWGEARGSKQQGSTGDLEAEMDLSSWAEPLMKLKGWREPAEMGPRKQQQKRQETGWDQKWLETLGADIFQFCQIFQWNQAQHTHFSGRRMGGTPLHASKLH